MQFKLDNIFRDKKANERFIRTIFRISNNRDPSWSEMSSLVENLEGINDISGALEIAKKASSMPLFERKYRHKAIKTKQSNLEVLILCTFPFDEPRHGGQHRLYNIRKAYQKAGCNVNVAGVLGSKDYPTTENFLPFPGISEIKHLISNTFLMEDWCLGYLFEHHDQWFARLASQISIEPDIIHVELPWLYGFSDRLIKTKEWFNTVLIYGSENIEHQLKHDILHNCFDHDHAQYAAEKVRQTELRAASDADFVFYVSNAEQNWLLQEANRHPSEIISVPNGAHPMSVTQEGLDKANKITRNHQFALFCASAHPPNITGFWHYFERGFGCFSPVEKLVIAGSAGASIQAHNHAKNSPCFSSRCEIAGEIDQHTLDALVATAHTIVLPIIHGSGTNLKSAEALVSGHYVVTTKKALRGFECYAESDGVYLADAIEDFLSAIRASMQRPPLSVRESSRELRSDIYWDSCLRNIGSFIQSYGTKSADLV
jgi:glycosyltransferase involved in cell wall biosynthesis